MSIHPAVADRFRMLEGIESFEQLINDPGLEEQFHGFMQWRDAAPAPAVAAVDTTVPGPHGPVPIRVYSPDGDASDRPCLVWHHGGASAGANLATAAVLFLRDEDGWVPATLIPVYGVFHPVLPAATRELEAIVSEVPDLLRFTPESTAGITANYLGGPPDSADGYAMPALADLTGLCRVVMFDAEYDDLRTSEESFIELLTAAGVDVRRHLAPGMLHGFLNLPAEIEPVGEVFELIATAVAQPVGVPHG